MDQNQRHKTSDKVDIHKITVNCSARGHSVMMEQMEHYTKTKFDEEAGPAQYSLSCCGLCYLSRAQRLVCACVVSLPLVLVTSLLATLTIRALALSDRFQLEALSDDDITFISPSKQVVNGR